MTQGEALWAWLTLTPQRNGRTEPWLYGEETLPWIDEVSPTSPQSPWQVAA
jgi:hypothetical protein